jgi:hypothetical protein
MNSKTYKQTDIETPEFRRMVVIARDIWNELSIEAYIEHGDTGACTLGGGIYMYVIPPRCRKAVRMLIATSPYRGQGEVAMFAGMKEAAEYIRSQGYECVTDYGRMD